MDLFRALFLIIGFFVLEKLDSAHSQNKTIRQCQYIPQLYETQLKGQSCLQSQMADETRYSMTIFHNHVQTLVSTGRNSRLTKYKNLFQMHYHWVCEYIAMHILDSDTDKGPSLKKETVATINTEITTKILADTVNPVDLGSFGKDSADIETYDYTFHRVTLSANEKHQIGAVEQYKFGVPDPTLTTTDEKPPLFYPGTTYFGCAFRVNAGAKRKRQSTDRGAVVCVYATKPNAERKLTAGETSSDTCGTATPKGVFDADTNLCIDASYMSSPSDVPCQFYYTNVPGGTPDWMKMSCDGADITADRLFTTLQMDTEVNFGKQTPLMIPSGGSGGDSGNSTEMNGTAKDAALKLHSIPISLMIFIASISAIFSQS